MPLFEELSDTEIIFLILAAFYLSECSIWLRRQIQGFSSIGGRFRRLRTLSFVENNEGGLVVTNLLPFTTTFLCEEWPIAISPAGIDRLVDLRDSSGADSDTGGSIAVPPPFPAFDEIQSIRAVERQVLVNDRRIAHVGLPAQARFMAELLQNVWKTPAAQREAAIDAQLAQATDVQVVTDRITRLRADSLPLRFNCSTLFVFSFVLLPYFYFRHVAVPINLWLLVGLFFILWYWTILSFYLAHRRCYPEGRGERRKSALLMCISPAMAMRAAEILLRPALVSRHPLAVAASVCSRTDLIDAARISLFDLSAAISGSRAADGRSPVASVVTDWYREHLKRSLEGVIRQAGIEPHDLMAAPVPDADARSYCPRCLTQFVLIEGACESCGGVRLTALAPSEAAVPPGPPDAPPVEVARGVLR